MGWFEVNVCNTFFTVDKFNLNLSFKQMSVQVSKHEEVKNLKKKKLANITNQQKKGSKSTKSLYSPWNQGLNDRWV